MSFIIIDPVASDNVVNASEHQASVSIGGIAVGPAFVGPMRLDITGPGNVALTLYATIDPGNGAWSVSLDAATVAGLVDGTFSITASTTDWQFDPLYGSAHFQVVTALPGIAIDVIAGDDVLNAAEQAAALTVTGTASGADGQQVTLGVNGTDYTGTVAGGAWSITIPQGDAAALTGTDYQLTAFVTDTYGNAAIPATRTLDVRASLPTVTFDAIAGDDVLNAAEQATDLVVSGSATGADGQQVTVGVNGTDYVGTITGGAWSVTIPQSDVAALTGADYQFTAFVTDPYGNAATPATHTLSVHSARPTITIDPIAGDNVLSAIESGAALTLTGTESGADGQVVGVLLDGTLYTGQAVAGAWSITVPQEAVAGLANNQVYTVVATVPDSYGNDATPATASLTVANTPPSIGIDGFGIDGTLGNAARAADLSLTGTETGADGQVVVITVHGVQYSVTAGSGSWAVTIPQADLAALTNGQQYQVLADVTDAYGNVASTRSTPLTIAAAPTIGIDAVAGDDVVNAAEHAGALTVSGTETGADNRTVTVALNGQTYTAVAAAGAWSVTVPQSDVAALQDLTVYAITAGVTDAYGTPALQQTRAVPVHVSLPGLAIDAIATDGILNAGEHNQALTVTGTDTGANGQVITLGLNGHDYTTTAGNGTWSVTIPRADVAALADLQSYSVTADGADGYGNVAATAAASLAVATTLPTIAIAPVAGDDVLNVTERAGAFAISGTAIGAEGRVVHVGFGAHSYAATVTAGTWSASIPQNVAAALIDGRDGITADVTDANGNAAIQATRTLTVDTSLPSIGIAAVAGDDVINAAEHGAPLLVSGTATGADGQTLTLLVDGVVSTATVTSGAWSATIPTADVADLQQGAVTIEASVSSSIGNASPVASRSVLVATGVPTLSMGVIAGDDALNTTEHGAALTIAGGATGASGGTVTVALNNHAYTATVSHGLWLLTVPQHDVGGLGDGSAAVVATLSDRYGNPATPATRTLLVAATPPSVGIGPISGDDALNAAEHNAALTIAGTATAATGATVTLGVGGHTYTAAVVSGAWSVSLGQPAVGALAEGLTTVTATIQDGVGNTGAAAPRVLTVDTIAPIAPTLHLTFGDAPSVSGIAEPGAAVGVFIDSHAAGASVADQNGAWNFVLPAPAPGVHSATAVQADAAGNASAASVTVELPRAGTDFAASDPDFDASYYLAHNPDVAASGMDPLQHYLHYGWHEGRNPNAYFNTEFYLNQNPDVAAAGVDPLQHYESNGWREGRDPSALFSTNGYLASNPDVAAAGIDPLAHYLHDGQAETRMAFITTPHATGPQDPLVDAAYYYAHNPAAAAAGLDATVAFNASGWQQGANPNAFFDVGYYLSHNPDVAAAGINPLLHYENFGWKEGRDPSAAFSTSGYLAANPDVAAVGLDPLEHFVDFGQNEGRSVIPV